MMRNTIIGIVAVVILVAGFIFAFGDGKSAKVESGGTDALAAYFGERLTAVGVQKIGQPIEGFDANLLMMAFPGFRIDDFDKVESFEGMYRVRGGNLEWSRIEDEVITSAEKTVSSDGYRTLLQNVAKRLQINVQSNSDADRIIEELQKNGTNSKPGSNNTTSTTTAENSSKDRVETGIGRSVSAKDVTITPETILEDSRCPVEVQCIQAGTVRVRTRLQSGLGEARPIFVLNQPITTEAEEVTLVEVRPESRAGVSIAPEDYRFVFEVKKRTDNTSATTTKKSTPPEATEPDY